MGNIGTIKDNRRFFPIHQLCSSMTEIICRVLPAVHALSGCDTTSSLFGIGKKSVYKVLKDSALDFSDLYNLGDSDTETAISCSRRFVARLYDQKKKYASCHQDINKLQVKLATSKDSSLVRLPPLKRRFDSISFVPHFRPKFGMLPVLQNHPFLHH
ncbi:unnamed protein product [Mytilus coruscus]|uniref:Uncharacterized protein n=1 Tax=Mytilus coruscus TaxID=42192 RepID=A0A6J8EIF7_MYTCO|nr:unnamed protein product [Mytilus coruscus]